MLNECPYMEKDEWEKFLHKKNKTSQYLGVSFIGGKWVSQIWDGKTNITERHESEVDAALSYNKKALKLRGSKAKLNII
jgi:hypothetical protein